MEFKVIFIGFALHCVLNTVLICKSVLSKDQELTESAIAQKEEQMLHVMTEGEGEIQRLPLQADSSTGKDILSLKH